MSTTHPNSRKTTKVASVTFSVHYLDYGFERVVAAFGLSTIVARATVCTCGSLGNVKLGLIWG